MRLVKFGWRACSAQFLGLIGGLLICASAATAFESYEHSEIGDEAFRKAVRILDASGAGTWSSLRRRPFVHSGHEIVSAVSDGTEITRLSFGDLVAIYGDYAVTFQDVNNAAFGRRASNLKSLVRAGNFGRFPNERDHAIELSINNVTHFSRVAAQSYVENHRRALLLAKQRNRLWEALHYEALALHSLTDLFAFGHMHEDRQLTDRLFALGRKGNSPTGLSAATRLSFATLAGMTLGVYVNFYHNAYNHRGAMLKNFAGDVWRGYGDKRYRIADPGCTQTGVVARRNCPDTATRRQRQIIVHAAAVSLSSVLKTAAGRPPRFGDEFIAMCYVPVVFWDTKRPVAPENQKLAIAQLAAAMARDGRELSKSGFDFSLGILGFERWEWRGAVEYLEYVRQSCGRL